MTSMADQLQDFITGEKTCPIWGTECEQKTQDTDSITVAASPRAGGDYVIEKSVFPELRRMYAANPGHEFADTLRARLTTILVKQRQLGNDLPRITERTIEAARSAGRARMEERLKNLLRFLVDSTPIVGQPIDIGYPRRSIVTGNHEEKEQEKAKRNVEYALAYSESTNFLEIEHLAKSLAMRGLVDKDQEIRVGHVPYRPSGSGFLCLVTSEGYSAIEQLQTERKSDQCFVAMWFNQETHALYDKAIAPAVSAAGYQPIRIDRQTNFLGKIDDQIIAEIRRSRFVIADFTHDERGARGSVYYEAGLAHGLDIPVIFTCRDDQIDDLHFDTNHFLHLAWSADAPEELIEPLKNRITANIGEGPHVGGGE